MSNGQHRGRSGTSRSSIGSTGTRPRSSVSRRPTLDCFEADTRFAHAPTTAMGFKKVAGKCCCGRGSLGSTWTTSVMIECRQVDSFLASHGLRWGEVTVVGLCIPWSGSRTAKFGGARREWEDHEVYLEHLAGVLSRAPSKRLVVTGDFNQRVGESSGKSNQPRSKAAHRAALLQRAIPRHVTLATSALEYRGRRTIDHIASSADMAAESLDVISNIHGERKLSDHFGVVADVLVQGS